MASPREPDRPTDPVCQDQGAAPPDDAELLRRAVALAAHARSLGNHPFGALLADGKGAVLLESENAVNSRGDATAHAELLLASNASRRLPISVLSQSTLYTSTEPCAMCAGAIYWAGIGRVVFALAESDLLVLTGADNTNPTMTLGCRAVFASGQHVVEVVGPTMLDEALAVHDGFWS